LGTKWCDQHIREKLDCNQWSEHSSNPSDAVVIQNGASNITLQNLTISNICVHTVNLGDAVGCNAGGVNDQAITLNGVSNITITGNTVHDSQNCIYDNMADGNSNITISQNIISHCNWGIGVGQTGTSSGLTITGNDISDAYVWDTNADAFHHNGVMVYGTGSSTTLNGLLIAGNYIHGNMGANETGHIFLDPTGSPLGNMPNVLIYNNVLVSNSSNGPTNGYITVGYGITGAGIYNNTISGNGQGTYGIDVVGAMVENNIVTGVYTGEEVDRGHTSNGSSSNVFYGLTGSTQSMCYDGTCYPTIVAWNAATGFDPLPPTIISNPNLTATYTLGSGTPANNGINLTSLGIAGLDVDKAGISRPSTGAWNMGACLPLIWPLRCSD